MDKEELWKAMKAPTEKSCTNCRTGPSYFACSRDDDDRCVTDRNYYSRWEWDGVK